MTQPTATVYFDGACPICAREVSHYRRLLSDQQLAAIDIAAPDFDANAHALDANKLQGSLHVRMADGQVVTGVDALAAIWQQLPRLQWLATASRLPVSRQAMQAGYAVFARLRPHLPGRKPPS